MWFMLNPYCYYFFYNAFVSFFGYVLKIHAAAKDETNMEQNVAAPEDSIPNGDKNPTEGPTSTARDDATKGKTADAIRAEEKSINDPTDEPNGNTGDAVGGEEQSVDDEDNTASHLRSGKALAHPTTTGKKPPKLTVHEFYR